MSAGDAPTWPELLHALWRSAFSAGSTKVFAKELYLGLLELPHVRGVLGARTGPDGTVLVVRWADHEHGVLSGPAGLAADVAPWVTGSEELEARPAGQAKITELGVAELSSFAPALGERMREVGGTAVVAASFHAAEGDNGLLLVALDRAPEDEVVARALEQIADVVIAADDRIADQALLDNRLAADAVLAEVSLRLAGSLDVEETLRSVVRMAVPGLADGAAVHVRRDGALKQIAAAHVDVHRERLLNDHLRQGRWAGLPVTAGDEVDPLPSGLPADVGLELMTSAVLRARGRLLGVLTFFHRAGARRVPTREFVRDIAARAALAIDNATLYSQRRAEVEELQQHLLPSVLPAIDGVELATGYNVAGHLLDVGGDFYGVVRQPDDRFTALIGDVCGRGAAAAALTGLARHTVETILEEGGGAEDAVRLLNAKMLRNRVGKFLTLAAVTFGKAGPDGLPMRSLTAGHPPPVIIRRDGAVEETACRGHLVGVLDQVSFTQADDVLRPGDSVVLFTDGLVEARDASGAFFGDEDLEPTLAALHDLPLPEMAAALVAGDGRYAVDDDAAVLLIRYRGPRHLDAVLPADQAADAALAAVRELGRPGLPDRIDGPAGHEDVTVIVDGDAGWARIEISGGAGTWWEVL
ncbi:PP2C family protein-serine/threonine phosphatase [Lentzea sp. HUAS12]|uniref:PP2C family protein-serine/threonine phosphatase n=1 Tax=Lentzea sp. HUAS12 TaxID=2951806 RepID=UPI00209E4794|nr:SpoIIE family protein phosphatase [Lentzea sp. HUAS12]USX54614.1 SpoIIE family protein phosphatase [Lentzea sp. HUAS12]